MADAFPKADKDSSMMAAVAAFFGGIVAIAIYLLRPNDRFVKFYALQEIIASIAVGVIFGIVWALTFGIMVASNILAVATGGVGALAGLLAFLPIGVMMLFMVAYLIVKLYAAYSAFSGAVFRIPFAGNFAEKYI